MPQKLCGPLRQMTITKESLLLNNLRISNVAIAVTDMFKAFISFISDDLLLFYLLFDDIYKGGI